MTASIEQERADFEAWARDRYPSIDLTRDRNDYSKALAKDYWSLWQSARRAPAAPVQQDAATHNKNLNGFIDFANQIDFANPRSASLKRKFILETRDAILDLFRDNLKLHRKVDALSAAPQPPEAAQASVSNGTLEAPVQLPEPDAYKHTLDSTEGIPGNKPRVKRTERSANPFGVPGIDYDKSFPCSIEKLYTEQQVRQLLAAHGIEVAP